ncbi:MULTISPECIES: transglutaminase family protein [Cryobacterium]|uniref:Transglutaminase family protein n=1 Tax=Cryobacterium glucosi TaxID=1259175 RepID=A0ABY2IRI3_9MICO|nr:MULTISPECIES: transglutaminase family protein [Cryobacterium]TFB98804.1 transglutaminase family protein [Cryobacterium sp. MDB2-A-1]TFC04280.1 transglutaminase family protein [Cryobacterium sp. MDB2-33-2]TFC14946.1 transglutaminase family protein [Cryobacterium sp. MDB2-A-2]TFC16452.1 transglutaminase family protein [Cryobacterium sp. MDB2-10]TFC21179.1 transglutaminase family protein [Cryobacterium glucosi]
MERNASARLALDVRTPARLVLSIGVADDPAVSVVETFTAAQDGTPLESRIVFDQHGTRLHVVETGAGSVDIDYAVTATGQASDAAYSEIDLVRYLRPSRYCESDRLWGTAAAEFAGLSGTVLMNAVAAWVGGKLRYEPGSSLPTDGAVRTLIDRQGVCRDFAHLVVALLRARDVPARVVSVYAPGLSPMDFHAVAEVFVDDAWHVVDATGLAPRQTLLRIATGRDAADTAFLTTIGGAVFLRDLTVSATVDTLPRDDRYSLVRLH